MTFASVGSLFQATASSFSLTPAGAGNLFMLAVENPDTAVWCTGVSSTNVTWVQYGVKFTGTTNARSMVIFAGKVISASAATVTCSFNGTPTNVRADGHEFSSTVGSWVFDKQGNLDSAGTSSGPSLAAVAGELYFEFSIDSGSASPPTPNPDANGYTYSVDVNGNGIVFNPNRGTGTTNPVWGDSSQIFGVAVLVMESVISAAGPVLRFSPSAVARPVVMVSNSGWRNAGHSV